MQKGQKESAALGMSWTVTYFLYLLQRDTFSASRQWAKFSIQASI